MNEQDKATYERVREQLLAAGEDLIRAYQSRVDGLITAQDFHAAVERFPTQILHLPGVAVLADDQTLPAWLAITTRSYKDSTEVGESALGRGYRNGQSDMFHAGWKRTVKTND